MDMIAADMSSQQRPSAAGTHCVQAFHDDLAPARVHHVGFLLHSIPGLPFAALVRLGEEAAKLIQAARDSTRPAWQPSSVASPCNQVSGRSLAFAVLFRHSSIEVETASGYSREWSTVLFWLQNLDCQEGAMF
ncbi:MAG: hypothetical protein ACRD4O_15150 [Bryobacteraceae bacterium]